MDTANLKKYLAGLCIAGLLSGANLTITGCEKHGETS